MELAMAMMGPLGPSQYVLPSGLGPMGPAIRNCLVASMKNVGCLRLEV